MCAQTLTDTQLLLELVGEAYSFEDLPQFRSGVIDVLNRVVPSDRVGYNEITASETYAVMIPEFDASLMPIFTKFAHENPLISYIQRTGDGRPHRISDMIDRETFHATALYRQFYRPMGIESQVAFSLPSAPDLLVGVALTRERKDFSDREVGLLSLARPHLIQAYRKAELRGARLAMLAALEQGLDSFGRHVIVLDAGGRIEFATDGARRLLGASAVAGHELHEDIGMWIAEHRLLAPPEPLLLSGPHGHVLVRLLPRPREDRREVLLLEGGAGQMSVEALQGLGLTSRQAEALRYLALGLSPARTAAEMGITRRTLDKHLQHVYARLGVLSRSEATATAWAAVGTEPGVGG